MKKVKEHYGIDLSASSIRQTTMMHAQVLYENEILNILPSHCQPIETIIAEMDGCMVPVVETNEESDDRRNIIPQQIQTRNQSIHIPN